MKNEASQFDELQSLLGVLLDGQLDARQRSRLVELLKSDAAARRFYLTWMLTDAVLRAEHRRPLIEEPLAAADLPRVPQSFLLEDACMPSIAAPASFGNASAQPADVLGMRESAAAVFSRTSWREYVVPCLASAAIMVVLGAWAWMSKISTVAPSTHSERQVAEKNILNDAMSNEPVTEDAAHSEIAGQPARFVGRVTGEVDCKWTCKTRRQGDAETRRHANSTVSPSLSVSQSPRLVCLGDCLSVGAGLLEITFDSSAKVILEGPCRFNVEENGGFLAEGRLTGKMEKKVGSGQWAVGCKSTGKVSGTLSTTHYPLSTSFVIATPTAVVTDLGTEFGVEVDKSGEVDARVFAGRVRVVILGKNGKDAVATKELKRDEAVHVAVSDRAFHPTRVQWDRFARRLPQKRKSVEIVTSANQNTEHDFLKLGVRDTIWSGVLNADKASRLDTLPVMIDGAWQHGLLTIGLPKDSWAGWAGPHRGRTWNNAPYLFVNVEKGDFEAQVQVQSQTMGRYSAAGLMVHAADGSYVSVNFNRFGPKELRFATRSTWRNIDCDNWLPTPSDKNIALRLVRMGNTFLAYGSNDNGDTWIPLDWGKGKNSLGGTLLHLPDAAGAVQVGLWYGTFNPMPGQASFHKFMIRGGGY